MRTRLATALTAVLVLVLAVPAAASAHRLRVAPRFAPIGEDFSFFGGGWQPGKAVRWSYDEFADGTFEQSGRFRVPRSGRFELVWEGEDIAATHRICISQFDSRRRFRRNFLRCRSFTAVQD